jgi:hypothetical protein
MVSAIAVQSDRDLQQCTELQFTQLHVQLSVGEDRP